MSRPIRRRCGRPPAPRADSSPGLGAAGHATRRDLSSRYRVLFWALLGLIVFGLVAIFVSIPNENVIWAVAGLVIFGGYTILDFNRLRRSGQEEAVPIAASIFLDVLNIFLFFLQLFGGNNEYSIEARSMSYSTVETQPVRPFHSRCPTSSSRPAAAHRGDALAVQ